MSLALFVVLLAAERKLQGSVGDYLLGNGHVLWAEAELLLLGPLLDWEYSEQAQDWEALRKCCGAVKSKK